MNTLKVVLVAVLVPLPMLLLHLDQPPVVDAAMTYWSITRGALTGVPVQLTGEFGYWHMPTYLYLGAASIRLFGESPAAVRLVGILCFFGTTLLVAWIVRRLAPQATRDRWALFAAFAYAIQPLAVNGALLIDWDNTVLTVATTAFCGWWAVHGPPDTWRRCGVSALLFAVMLLAKETAVAPMIPCLGLYLIARRAPLRQWALTALSLVAGAAAALAVFGIFCAAMDWPFDAPFRHNHQHLIGFLLWPPGVDWLIMRARFVATYSFWVAPPVALLLAGAVAGSVRKLFPKSDRADGVDLLLLVGGCITAAYLIINGVTWWFPRYETPAWALLVAGGTVWAARRWEGRALLRPSLILAGGSVALWLAVIGDLNLLSLHDLKLSMIGEGRPTRSILVELGWKTALALVPLAVWRFWPGRRPMAAALPALLIGPALAAHLFQIPYEHTTYGYGTSGTVQMVERLKTLPPDAFVMGPYEAPALAPVGRRTTGERDFDHPKQFVALASEPSCGAVVLSLSRNSVAHLKLVRENAAVRALLESEFTEERIGDYWVWIRRPKRP